MQFTDDDTGAVLDIHGCLLNYVTPAVFGWLSWHLLWQRGLLPRPGGVLDQPAKYVDVMEFLDGVLARKQAADDADRRRTLAHPQVS